MAVIRLGQLPVADAEYLVAQIWLVLEEYSISSPTLAVQKRGGSVVEMRLTFGATADAELVRTAIRRLKPHASIDALVSRAVIC